MQIEKTGQPVVICRNGKPVAELSPFKPHKDSHRLETHPVMGKIRIGYDPIEDLSDDEWGVLE